MTGDNLNLVGDTTDVFGNFSLAVPPNAIELRMDATSVIGRILAFAHRFLAPSANTTLPDVTLKDGWVVSGTVTDASAWPVENADVDVVDSARRVKLYTPGDDTDAFGNFTVVVPTGTWDLEICPDPDDMLVAADAEGVEVAGDLFLGVFPLLEGVWLSGIVRDLRTLRPVPDVDVDVTWSGTGSSIVTCNDETTPAGTFAVLVPVGTLDVTFHAPPYSGQSRCLETRLYTGVVVTGPRIRNGVLRPCGPREQGAPALRSGARPVEVR